MPSAKEVIEQIARGKGTFTNSFRKHAEKEAKSGRETLLQMIQGAEEIRQDHARALKMYCSSAVS
jgi:hypothetical protein